MLAGVFVFWKGLDEQRQRIGESPELRIAS